MAPRKYPTSPDNMTRVPLVSWSVIHFLGWKNVAVTLPRPEPRVTRNSLSLGRFLIGSSTALGDLVDECDVLAFGRSFVVGATHGGAFDVAAGVVAQQVVDGADAEHLVERVGRFGADDVIQAVAERHHGYSTPISSASPRCPVR